MQTNISAVSSLTSITSSRDEDVPSIGRDRGAFYPQLILTFMLCIGTFFFGHVLNWSEVGLRDMKELQWSKKYVDSDYVWLLCAAPLGIAIGIGIWGFVTRRIGPKRTLIFTTPFLFISHFLKGYFNTYKMYYSSQVLSGFSVASYFLTGEVYLTECIHRKNIKLCTTIFRSSIMLGILTVDICSTFFSKIWLCVGYASANVVYLIILLTLHDSPYYLIENSVTKAENALKFYLGKSSVEPELNLVRQHLNFIRLKSNNMLSYKVVIKAFAYISLIQLFKIGSGYYIFIFDKVRIYKLAKPFINSYADNIITGVVLLLSKLIFLSLHLFGNFGIKIPIIFSFGATTIVLFIMGTIDHLSENKIFDPMKGWILLSFLIYIITYDSGLCVCTEIMLYAYTPYQVYNFLKKVMFFVQWSLIFILTRIYMEVKLHWGLDVVAWICAAFSAIGFIFSTIVVVEIKGKSLPTIQMELGCNPVGTRGSARQRISCPYESTADMNFLDHLIAEDLARNKRRRRLSRFASLRKL